MRSGPDSRAWHKSLGLVHAAGVHPLGAISQSTCITTEPRDVTYAGEGICSQVSKLLQPNLFQGDCRRFRRPVSREREIQFRSAASEMQLVDRTLRLALRMLAAPSSLSKLHLGDNLAPYVDATAATLIGQRRASTGLSSNSLVSCHRK